MGVRPPLRRAAQRTRSPSSRSDRRKSPPVPRGSIASAAPARTGLGASPGRAGWKNPFTTSLMVPSPPTAITRSWPARSASRVRSAAVVPSIFGEPLGEVGHRTREQAGGAAAARVHAAAGRLAHVGDGGGEQRAGRDRLAQLAGERARVVKGEGLLQRRRAVFLGH